VFFFSADEGPAARINVSKLQFGKVTSALWGTLDQFIVTGHENGEIVQWDIRVNLIVSFEYSY
jgi:translation initiation factor 3 subunit I